MLVVVFVAVKISTTPEYKFKFESYANGLATTKNFPSDDILTDDPNTSPAPIGVGRMSPVISCTCVPELSKM